jgi:hypothetical protein
MRTRIVQGCLSAALWHRSSEPAALFEKAMKESATIDTEALASAESPSEAMHRAQVLQ